VSCRDTSIQRGPSLTHLRHRWILTKLVPKQSRTNETLHFLLDHPRRCFIYLFPSHQTWFLVTILIILKYVCLGDLSVIWYSDLPSLQFHRLVLLHGFRHRESGYRLYSPWCQIHHWITASCCCASCWIWFGTSVCSSTSSKVRQNQCPRGSYVLIWCYRVLYAVMMYISVCESQAVCGVLKYIDIVLFSRSNRFEVCSGTICLHRTMFSHTQFPTVSGRPMYMKSSPLASFETRKRRKRTDSRRLAPGSQCGVDTSPCTLEGSLLLVSLHLDLVTTYTLTNELKICGG